MQTRMRADQEGARLSNRWPAECVQSAGEPTDGEGYGSTHAGAHSGHASTHSRMGRRAVPMCMHVHHAAKWAGARGGGGVRSNRGQQPASPTHPNAMGAGTQPLRVDTCNHCASNTSIDGCAALRPPATAGGASGPNDLPACAAEACAMACSSWRAACAPTCVKPPASATRNTRTRPMTVREGVTAPAPPPPPPPPPPHSRLLSTDNTEPHLTRKHNVRHAGGLLDRHFADCCCSG